MRHLFYLSLIVIMMSCAGNTPPKVNPVQGSTPGITRAFADSLWAARTDTAAAFEAILAYRYLASSDSSSIEYWSKLSRAYYFYGHYLMQDPTQRDSLYMQGYEASQAILNQDTEYHELLFSTGDENMAIRGLSEGYLDALYWGMANYGQWLATKGRLIRLGQRDVIWTTLEHVNDLDSNYYFGAYYRYKGALLSRDPEFQNNVEEIRSAFERAREIAPNYFGNNTLMAAYYCPLTRDKELFYQLLTEVITAQLDTSLPYHAENVQEKRMAERLLMKAEKENWFSL